MATKTKKKAARPAAKKKADTQLDHFDKSLLSSAVLSRVTGNKPHEIADYFVTIDGERQRRMDLISKMPQEWIDKLGIE